MKIIEYTEIYYKRDIIDISIFYYYGTLAENKPPYPFIFIYWSISGRTPSMLHNASALELYEALYIRIVINDMLQSRVQ
jgi:hypothetical protein